MRILVTGSQGQVARCLAERAIGHELVFATRPDFDLASPDTITPFVQRLGPDLVISAAAYTAVDRAEEEPALAMAVNAEGPGILARAAAGIGAPILHLSTDYVFDGSGDRPWREDDPVAPIGAYGASKLAGEEAVARSGARWVIVRTAWVYSPYGANFVKTMLRLAADQTAVRVVADQVGCPTSALDIADALPAIAHALRGNPTGRADRVYHYAGRGSTSWAGLAEATFAESAAHLGPSAQVIPIASIDYPTRAKRPANSRLDCTVIEETFGLRAPPWRDSLGPVVRRLLADCAPAAATR